MLPAQKGCVILDFDKALVETAKACGWLNPKDVLVYLRDRFIDADEYRAILEQMAQAAVTRARREALEALPSPAQFRELDDVLDSAIRDKHKQIEAMHSADWVRPPEFDITERDEVWLADFTRQGIEELSALRVTLRKLARLAGEGTNE